MEVLVQLVPKSALLLCEQVTFTKSFEHTNKPGNQHSDEVFW